MRIAIAGAGAMGSMFGGYLTKGGHDVTLIDIDDEQVSAICDQGLLLRNSDGSSERLEIKATTNPMSDLKTVDAVIMLCKGWANKDAAESIRHAVGPQTCVATLQNGLGNDTRLAVVFKAKQILPGTTTAGAHKPEPAVVDVSPITSNGDSITQLGPSTNSDELPSGANDLVEALTSSGLPSIILPDADIVIWTKLAMAATAGPLTAALGATIEAMMSSPTAVNILRDMFDEIVAVGAAIGVELDADGVWKHAMQTYKSVGAHTTSMADDFAEGRRSEIDSFCIEISRLGAANKVPTPTHDTIGRQLVAREEQGGLR